MERLLICCLLCACSARMVGDIVLYDKLLKDVGNLMNMVKDDAEKLHTPTDVEVNCMSMALSCFINTTIYLKPIKRPARNKKFNESLSRIQSVQQIFLKTELLNNRTSEAKCPTCIDYPKQSPKDFLDKFMLLLQQLYRISLSSEGHLGY